MNDEVIEAMAMAYAEAEFADLLYKPLNRPDWIAFHLPAISARMRTALAAAVQRAGDLERRGEGDDHE